jgi:hypothetical protein
MSTTPVMALLKKKVPLTLLIDLADAQHMPSRAILRREAGDASWLRRPTGAPSLIRGRAQPTSARPS